MNHIYIYIHREREGQTDRQTEKECSYASKCLVESVIPWQNDQTGQGSLGQL